MVQANQCSKMQNCMQKRCCLLEGCCLVASSVSDLQHTDFLSIHDCFDHLVTFCAESRLRSVQRLLSRRGPNSDDFIPVKGGGSDYGGHSRGGSLGGKEESIFDPEEALLIKVPPLRISQDSIL